MVKKKSIKISKSLKKEQDKNLILGAIYHLAKTSWEEYLKLEDKLTEFLEENYETMGDYKEYNWDMNSVASENIIDDKTSMKKFLELINKKIKIK